MLFFTLGYFFPFYHPNSPKNQNFKKMEKMPGDIIILDKRTKNHDHMLYCSWDMACDGSNCYFSFWAIFCFLLFYPPNSLKIENFKKMKTIPRDSIILHKFTDMMCDRCNCYFSFWTIFSLFTTLRAKKKKKKTKMKKMPAGIIILHNKCTKNHDHILYCSWDMACDRNNCYFSFGAIFCSFTL